MAEQVKESRGYFEILDELFSGPSAALEKYAKVRFTQYEMDLWRMFNLPLKEVNAKAKRYFAVRFLGEGTRIDKASESEIGEAFKKLGFAVGKFLDDEPDAKPTGCHARCLKLVNELNGVLKANGLDVVSNPERFLDWLTFDYEIRTDELGAAIEEKPYGFVVRVFHDTENRKEFRNFLKSLKVEGRMMSMQDIYKIIIYKRKNSKLVK